MKSSIRTIAVALALAPAAAFAQTYSQPQTGDTGYTPSKTHYPNDVQGTQSRTGAQSGTNMTSDNGYGGVTSGTAQSGSSYRMMPHNNWRTLYGHH